MMYVQCDTVYVAWQKGIIIVIIIVIITSIRKENGEEKKSKINVGERKREERNEKRGCESVVHNTRACFQIDIQNITTECGRGT